MSTVKGSCVILGGTGAVGKCIVRDALASNSFAKVLTLGRRTVPSESFINLNALEQKTVDFEDIANTFPDSASSAADPGQAQVVFCTLATTRGAAGSAAAFRKIDQQYVLDSARYIHEKAPKDPKTGLSKVHFLYCSSGNANSRSFFLYSKVKGETEEALAKIGFERVSIFQPGFLKVVEPRVDGGRIAEMAVGILVPVMELASERLLTISVDAVGKAMRAVGASDEPAVFGVEPRKVEVVESSKTKLAFYSNSNIHDIVGAMGGAKL